MAKVIDQADQVRDELIAARLREALIHTHGVRTAAAKRLGMARRTFYRYLERLGLEDFHPELVDPTPAPRRGKVKR